MYNFFPIILLDLTLISVALSSENCGNGIFQCTSSTTLRICFNGKLVSTELPCPKPLYCCETSETICTKEPDSSCSNYFNENISDSSDSVSCSKLGIFPVVDNFCKKYILCLNSTNGYRGKKMTCQDDTLFDPQLKLCSNSYVCEDPQLKINRCQRSIGHECSETDSPIEDCNNSEPTTDPSTRIVTEDEHVCKKNGRFPIQDTRCMKYIYCIKTSNGFLTKVYECPVDSFFDPQRGRCTKVYNCPEISTTVKVTTEEVSSITPSTEYVTSTSNLSTITPEIPQCIKTGCYPILNTKCIKYLCCVKFSNGFLSNIYECPDKSVFDPKLKICTTNYICPETSTTVKITTEESITTAPTFKTTEYIPSSISTEADMPITYTSTDAETNTTISFTPPTEYITSTLSIVTVTPEIPICIKNGRYPIPNTGCMKYLYCIKTSNGFESQIYECPDDSVFDPKLERCTTDYICPETSTTVKITTKESITTSPNVETTEGATESTSSSTHLDTTEALRTTTEYISSSINTETDITTTSPIYTSTDREPSTTISVSPSTEYVTSSSSIVTVTPEVPQCNKTGRYPIPNTRCVKYLYCVKSSNGYLSKIYSCPDESVFDPKLERCTTDYVCPETSTTVKITTEESITTSPNVVTTEEATESTSSTTHVDTTEVLLTTIEYISSSIITETDMTTTSPIPTSTDREPSTSTTTVTPSTEYVTSTSSIVTVTPEIPECIKNGKYPIPNAGCMKYLYCIKTSTGFKSQVYECPPQSFFDPKLKRCTKDYVCPETSTTTMKITTEESITTSPNVQTTEGATESTSSTTHLDTTEALPTTTEYISSSLSTETDVTITAPYTSTDREPSTSTTTVTPSTEYLTSTSSIVTVTPEIPECIKNGKYPIPNTGCMKYLYCIKTSTGFKSQVYACPPESFFNPKLKRCTKDYVCPETSTTTMKITTEESITTSPNVQTTEGATESTSSTTYLDTTEALPTTTEYISSSLSTETDVTITAPYTSTDREPSTSTTTVTPSTEYLTSTSSIVTVTPEIPECIKNGKYPIPNTGCMKYLYCIKTSTGFKSQVYECPPQSFFDPKLKRCTKDYVCPETSTTTMKITTEESIITSPNVQTTEGATESTSSTTHLDTTEALPTTTEYISSSLSTETDVTITAQYTSTDREPSTSTTTVTPSTEYVTSTSSIVTVTPEIPECIKNGKYPIPNTGCMKYLYCIKTSTGFKSQVYECPPQSFFDPKLKRCTKDYVCPETSTTTMKITTEESITTSPNVQTTEGATESTSSTTHLDTTEALPTTTEYISSSLSTETDVTITAPYTSTDREPSTSTTTVTPSTEYVTSTSSIVTVTPEIPECIKNGKYPIPNTGCMKYLYCIKTSTGFKSQVYECPPQSFFDPKLKRCTKDYVCPETSTTTMKITTEESITTSPNVQTTEGATESTSSTTHLDTTEALPTTTEYISSSLSTETDVTITAPYTSTDREPSTSTTTVTPSTEYVTSTSSIVTVTPEIPECIKNGKYPIPNTGCMKYLYCIKTSTGFKSQVYACPPESFFNPKLKRCTKDYVCPETSTTTMKITTEESITTSPNVQTTEGATESTSSTTHLDTTEALPTTTEYISSSLSTETDVTITAPYTSTDREPSTSTTTVTPSTEYVTSTSSIVTVTPEIPECIKNGKYPIPNTGCMKYLYCIKTSTGFKSQVYACPPESFFNPKLKRCTKDYVCPETSTTTMKITTEESITTSPNVQTTEGATESTSSTTHLDTTEALPTTTEYISSSLSTETDVTITAPYTSTDREPSTSTTTVTPSTEYVTSTSTTPTVETTEGASESTTFLYSSNIVTDTTEAFYTTEEVINSTTELVTPPTTIFPVCDHNGRIYIPCSGCKRYILCILTSTGFRSNIYSCPKLTYFNPKNGRCYADFKCEEDNFVPDVKSNLCITVGSIPDPKDIKCEFYYNCTEIGPDNLEASREKCENGLKFDAENQICTENYECKQTRNLLLQNSKSVRLLDMNGKCTTRGRFVVPNTKCKDYVYCYPNPDGTLKGTKYTCPTKSVFNQVIQRCVSPNDYDCLDDSCTYPGCYPY